VGYIKDMNFYVITVVSNDTEEGWKAPLEEIKVENKSELFDKIQEVIDKYRLNYRLFVSELFDVMWKWTFFYDLKKSQKKYRLIIAAAILFLMCILVGIGRKFIWQGSFLEGFLYQFALLLSVFATLTILYILRKKFHKVGTVVVGSLFMLCGIVLLGVVLLLGVLILNSIFHFWF